MGKIFISYRQIDSDFANRLAEKLQQYVEGSVFIDLKIDKDDFVAALEREVGACNVFVLVVTDATFAPERIHQPADRVCQEIALALELHKPVVLAMHQGVGIPATTDLPENIRPIVDKPGLEIYHSLFDESVLRFARHCVTISSQTLRLKSGVVQPVLQAEAGDIAYHNHMPAHTYIENQTIHENKQQVLFDQLHLLKSDENRVRDTLQKLEYDLRHQNGGGLTFSGLLFGLVAIACLVALAFSIHQTLGIAALILLPVVSLWRFMIPGRNHAALNRQIQDTRNSLQSIQSQIAQCNAQIQQV